MEEYKHHIVYKTTNLCNGKVYVGVHSTNDLNDGYIGSGKRLKNAIDTGEYTFEREIVLECNSREEALELEELIVDKEFVLREDTYNIALGGMSGKKRWHQYNGDKKRAVPSRKGTVMAKCLQSGDTVIVPLEEVDDKSFSMYHKGLKRNAKTRKRISESSRGKVQAIDLQGNNVRVTVEEFNTGKYVGVQDGINWFHNPDTNEQIPIKNGEPVPNGFLPGRGNKLTDKQKSAISSRRKNSIWITDGSNNKQLDKGSKIPEGWRRGRTLTKSRHREGY